MIKDFQNKYKYKIKTIKQLKEFKKKLSKKEKVILCHGVFDVVHPGHIRHLIYAKTKADILIVSVTADKFIKKGVYRPHIPEDLRALNLAAFEMVDFVVVDKNENPLENISLLKPDFFAKGFEYTAKGLPKATIKESKAVESYGGKMIFTPGDVVYSSSNFLSNFLPHVQMEKLLILMNRNKVSFEILKKITKKLNNIKVHIIGDTIIDTYTRTSLIGGQIKTPTISVLYQNEDKYIGGAGIVAQHLKSAGANVTFTTVLGDDDLKKLTVKQLKKIKIEINAIIDKTRPTTSKNVIVANGYKVLKVDKLDNQPISKSILDKIIKKIKSKKSDIVIFSDFRHGIFNSESVKALTHSLNKNVFKCADSQVATRWGNISDFKNFDLITPNEKESRFALADQDSTISELTIKLKKEANYKNLILKLGEKGLFSVTSNLNQDHAFTIPSFVENLIDPVGSGDALLAYSSLALYKTKSLFIASIIGAIAAACECEKDGNIPVSVEEIVNKIESLEKEAKFL